MQKKETVIPPQRVYGEPFFSRWKSTEKKEKEGPRLRNRKAAAAASAASAAATAASTSALIGGRRGPFIIDAKSCH